jgi:hypothetical protein
VKGSAVKPDLVVLQRFPDLVPFEVLSLTRVAISGKSALDQCSFLFGDEFGFGGPVGDVPECSDSEDNGEKTLDDEDP